MKVQSCANCARCKDSRRIYDLTFDMEVTLYQCELTDSYYYETVAHLCTNYVDRMR